jgi:hypothetical protein
MMGMWINWLFKVNKPLPPLLLLDVDGVVNAATIENPDIYTFIEVNGMEIHYRPSVIEKINSWHLSGLVEIRWLTTWDTNAQTKLAPALGITEFLLARDPELELEKDEAAFRAIIETPDRPLIWIDDEVKFYCRITEHQNFFESRKNTLLVETLEPVGLTDEDLVNIESFARSFNGANNALL